jgi:hypothetical protein
MLGALAAILLAACGGSSSSTSSSAAPAAGSNSNSSAAASSSTATSSGQGAAAGALSAEVKAAGTGDIPDTQVYLTYSNAKGGYTITYPEGWAQRATGSDVVFSDKNNVIRAVVSKGPAPTSASVTAALKAEKAHKPSLTVGSASTIQIAGAPVIKITYSTISAPNPVTGKRIELLVDRYVYGHQGKVAILDLATPRGVDNIDAYRRISRSWRWK